MIWISFPSQAQHALLIEAARRDLTTARRVILLEILFHERFLTRNQLITRVNRMLGRSAFGKLALDDTFYRDIRAVKQAFRAAGYELEYRRNQPRPGYYLAGEPAASQMITEELAGAAAELDVAQASIIRSMTPAERAILGASLSDAAREAVAYRILAQNPGLSPAEANRLAVMRAYLP